LIAIFAYAVGTNFNWSLLTPNLLVTKVFYVLEIYPIKMEVLTTFGNTFYLTLGFICVRVGMQFFLVNLSPFSVF